MRRIETWIALGLLFLLAAFAVGHGIARLGALRAARKAEIVDEAARAISDLAAGIGTRAAELKMLTAYVARLAAQADVEGVALSAHLRSLVVSFPHVDRVRIFSETGAEVFRTERMGGGVATLPKDLLATGPDAAVLDLAAGLAPYDVVISDLHVDRDRVEVPESERKVVHFVARTPSTFSRSIVALSAYASPIFDHVRNFAPVAGARTVMVTRAGAYLATRAREREIGGPAPSVLDRDVPGTAPLLAGALRVEVPGLTVLATPVDEFPWIVVAEVPESALTAATARFSRDSALVIGGVVAALLVIGGAAIVFNRVARRAMLLREAEASVRELERKREMERRLATSERLSALGLLTAGVAHEVNNPLEGIGNYLTLLERDGVDPERRKRHLEAVRHGFDRIRDVVRRLLGFARPQRTTGTADLARVVARAAELARFSSQCRGVTFTLPDPAAAAPVAGDEGGLEQIVMNLYLNAGTAMGGTGSITVDVRRDGDRVALTVEDDGPGIPPENLERIFDPFFTTGEGSGLGLAVSYGIAQACGGSLVAENRVGRGARFILWLPAAPGAA